MTKDFSDAFYGIEEDGDNVYPNPVKENAAHEMENMTTESVVNNTRQIILFLTPIQLLH